MSITLRYTGNPAFLNKTGYKTLHSAGCDVVCQVDTVIGRGETVAIPTGYWIDGYTAYGDVNLMMPELQVRPRSGLSLRSPLRVANAPGTIDADYPNEICVLLWNIDEKGYFVAAGTPIAQLVLNYVGRIGGVMGLNDIRIGGFGSTDSINNLLPGVKQ